MTTATFDGRKIKQVYFGKAGRCCCGCAGNYHKPSAKGLVAKAIARITKVLANPEPAVTLTDHRNEKTPFISIEDGRRMTTIYFV